MLIEKGGVGGRSLELLDRAASLRAAIRARAQSYPQVIHNLSYLILDTTSSIIGNKKGRYVGIALPRH
jgi:hypothetical protein